MRLDLIDGNLIRVVLMLTAALVAVTTDTRERRIPNSLTLPLAVTGLGIGAASGGLAALVMTVLGMLVGGGFFLIPVMKLGWGMGDLKLAAALGGLGGPLFALWMGLYALAAGGLFALVWLKRQGLLAGVMGRIHGDLRAGRAPAARSGLAIPYAPAIAAGMLLALFVSPGLPG